MAYTEITDRALLMRIFEEGPVLVRNFIAPLSDAQLDFVPDLPDAWSIREHLLHLVDVESRVWVRTRMAIAQPGSTFPGFDHDAWCKAFYWQHVPSEQLLQTLSTMRAMSVTILKPLAGEDWTAFTVQTPAGDTQTLGFLVSLYSQHIDAHIDYMKRNLSLFNHSEC